MNLFLHKNLVSYETLNETNSLTVYQKKRIFNAFFYYVSLIVSLISYIYIITELEMKQTLDAFFVKNSKHNFVKLNTMRQ